ncbi:hypothetical protein OAY89_00010 [Bacteroidota bacterium]|nr:hypothetical protein [Bacteroidota bacterium]
MKLKYFALLPLFFSFSFIFSQSDKHNPWIIELGENVTNPLTNQEIRFIKSALGDEAYYRIINIKALEQNIKDILRNRVQILTKRYFPSEKFPKLSSILNSKSSQIFNKYNFNPLFYDFDFESLESQVYRVDGTDYIINIIPKRLK